MSTRLEFPQATVLAEPWVSLSELTIILWNDLLDGSFGQIWYRNLRCEHMGVSSGQHFSKQITSRKCWSNYLFWTTSSATLSRYCSSPSDCIQLMDLSTRQTQASLHLHWQCGLLMHLQADIRRFHGGKRLNLLRPCFEGLRTSFGHKLKSLDRFRHTHPTKRS